MTRNDELQCYVISIDYDFASKTGSVFMPPNNCTDMGGAVRLFTRIDADVRRIETWNGRAKDMAYYREGGKWHTEDWCNVPISHLWSERGLQS